MLDDVLAMPDHIWDATWRVGSARIAGRGAAGLGVCGMGGSAIGADLAVAALGDRLTGPMVTIRGYGLPTWMGTGWDLLYSSYSGETEETLAAFEAGGVLGGRRIVLSTGGELTRLAREQDVPVIGLPGILQPRAAVAYMFVAAAEVAALAGVAPAITAELDGAAAFLEQSREQLRQRAAELADRLGDRTCVIHGAGPTAPVAFRWATQMNENAKLMAFASEIPEANHNQVEAWRSGSGISAVFLSDPGQHPRLRRRIGLTEAAVAAAGAPTATVEAEGETPTARLMWSVMLGDLLSLELAGRRGVDPAPVTEIDSFKQSLGAA